MAGRTAAGGTRDVNTQRRDPRHLLKKTPDRTGVLTKSQREQQEQVALAPEIPWDNVSDQFVRDLWDPILSTSAALYTQAEELLADAYNRRGADPDKMIDLISEECIKLATTFGTPGPGKKEWTAQDDVDRAGKLAAYSIAMRIVYNIWDADLGAHDKGEPSIWNHSLLNDAS